MGLNASKRVERSIASSTAFAAVCEDVYRRCLDDAQHAFPGVLPYQLSDAVARLHATLSVSLPLVRRWVPAPPGRALVDAAYRKTFTMESEDLSLSPTEFRAFAAELFRDAVLAGAGRTVLRGVPIGVAGIAGVGTAARAGAEVMGRAMGVYAVAVVVAVYMSLG